MTDDSIEAKALALVNEIERERGEDELTPNIMRALIMDEALCRSIEQHEAFKQEVSDAVEAYVTQYDASDWSRLKSFIIPKPKPDPLVEVMGDLGWDYDVSIDYVKDLRAALEARGLEIREKGK
jgi:hypothetical protein